MSTDRKIIRSPLGREAMRELLRGLVSGITTRANGPGRVRIVIGKPGLDETQDWWTGVGYVIGNQNTGHPVGFVTFARSNDLPIEALLDAGIVLVERAVEAIRRGKKGKSMSPRMKWQTVYEHPNYQRGLAVRALRRMGSPAIAFGRVVDIRGSFMRVELGKQYTPSGN